MGELKKWLKQDWVRIGTDGSIKGKCGTSKDKKNPDRCSLQKLEASQKLKEHLQHERKRRREQKARQWYQIQNQQKLEIRKGGPVKRPFRGKKVAGTAVARGCGAIMARRKRTKGAVTQS